MSTEKQERYEVAIPFYLRGPENISTSDFNSIILRLSELRDFISSSYYHGEIEIDQHNRNIEEIQLLLNNFKIRKKSNKDLFLEENNEEPDPL